jgi:predicted transcriptional regulator
VSEPKRTIPVKMPQELIRRLDELAEKIARPGRGSIRSEAILASIYVGLDAIDRDPSVLKMSTTKKP